MCKGLREDAQKLREEKTTLEGMVKSRDELIMEIAKEYGLNRKGENDDDEDEDDDDGGDATAPLVAAPPPAPVLHVAVPEEIIEEGDPEEMVPKQEAPEAHEVVLADAESELSQPRLFNKIMRDYKESPPRMVNGLHELDDLDDFDDPTEAEYDVDEWFLEDGSNDRDWVIKSKS
jgi:hypothetical protein